MQTAEEKSLDLVQRLVVSSITVVVFGGPTVALAAYAPHRSLTSPGDGTGLWVMGLLLGLACAVAVLLVNRRRPWHPAVLVGAVPAVVSAWWMWLR